MTPGRVTDDPRFATSNGPSLVSVLPELSAIVVKLTTEMLSGAFWLGFQDTRAPGSPPAYLASPSSWFPGSALSPALSTLGHLETRDSPLSTSTPTGLIQSLSCIYKLRSDNSCLKHMSPALVFPNADRPAQHLHLDVRRHPA